MIKCFKDYLYQKSQLDDGIQPLKVQNINCNLCERYNECEVCRCEQAKTKTKN